MLAHGKYSEPIRKGECENSSDMGLPGCLLMADTQNPSEKGECEDSLDIGLPRSLLMASTWNPFERVSVRTHRTWVFPGACSWQVLGALSKVWGQSIWGERSLLLFLRQTIHLYANSLDYGFTGGIISGVQYSKNSVPLLHFGVVGDRILVLSP